MSDLLHPNRIARKLIKALIVFSTVLTIGITALQLWTEYGRDVSAIEARFAQVERSYLGSVAETVWQADDAGLELLLNGIIEFPDFELARVRDESGEVLLAAGAADVTDRTARSYELTYMFRGKPRKIGTLEVAASLTGVYARVWDRVGLILLTNAAKTALVAGFLFALVFWLFTRHLDTMAKFARALTFEQDTGELVLERSRHAGGRDELDDLASALNEMKHKLFESYADLRQLSDELEVRVRGRTRALSEEVAMRKRIADKLTESESRLRDVAEAGSDWIWEMDADLRFTSIAGGAVKDGAIAVEGTLGRRREELTGEDTTSDKWRAHFDDLKNHRPFRDFEYQSNVPGGETIHMRVSGKPVFDAQGRFQGYRGMGSDITRQVLAERRAHEAAEELRVLSSAVRQNPSAVFITDKGGTIQFVNDKFTALTGFTADEAIGKNPRILKSDHTPREVHGTIWKHILDGREWRGELQDQHKDGTLFWAYATIAPVKNEAGEITHFVATHEDITERKLNEQRLREATERAEIANRTKSEIMANMSHELRTPLNAIIGFSDTMLNGVFGALDNERYEDYVTDINESGKHLLELINDILDVSAIEAGKLELRAEPLEVLALMRSSLKLVQHRADGAQVKLESHVEKDMPGLLADARRVKQVLLNLLTNAVKFTPEGGRVAVTASRATDGGVRFEIADTGIGMDEAGIETALAQFGQVDSKLARKYEGTGLGLPLTKSLVELHSGTLDIRSRLGHGTTVVVHFPPERSIAPDADLDDDSGVVAPLSKGRAVKPDKPDTVH